MASFKMGDHIYAPIDAVHGVATHHGIYVGRGNVIHFTGLITDPGNAKIQVDKLSLFSTKTPKVRDYAGADVFSPREVVRRARSRLGERGYSLTMNNCEHFASWCKVGSHRSSQVDTGMVVLAPVGGVVDAVERAVYKTTCACNRSINGLSTVWLCARCGTRYCTSCIARLKTIPSGASKNVDAVADFFGVKKAVRDVSKSLSHRRCKCGNQIDASQRIRQGVM